MSKIYLPSRLRPAAHQKTWVEIEGATVHDLLNNLIQTFPDLSQFILREGQLNLYTRIFVNHKEVRDLMQKISAKDEIHIIQAMAGG